MAIRTQSEILIFLVVFIRRTKDAASEAACAGNVGRYNSEYRNSWFNNSENDEASSMFRSFNNCNTPLPNKCLMKRTSYNCGVIYNSY